LKGGFWYLKGLEALNGPTRNASPARGDLITMVKEGADMEQKLGTVSIGRFLLQGLE
jgi:hypothetical protein